MRNFRFFGVVFLFLGQFFSRFFVIFLYKTLVFCEAGWSSWVKNTFFFHAKLQFFQGWVLFLVNFLPFVMQNFSFLRGWEVFLSIFFFMQNLSFCGAGCSFWVQKGQLKLWSRGGGGGASRGAILCATSLFRSSLRTSYSPGRKCLKLYKKSRICCFFCKSLKPTTKSLQKWIVTWLSM